MLQRIRWLARVLRGGEKGQMLIMVAGGLTTMLFVAALTIDLGIQARSKRQAQNAADAMVLAGAQELCGTAACETAAKNTAMTWAAKNGVSGAQVTYNEVNGTSCLTPAPETDYITARIRMENNTFLAHVFGIAKTEVNVCATARATVGEGGYAIFANNTGCNNDTLEISGSTNLTVGAVHSNGWLKVGGQNNVFDGETTYTCKLTAGDNTYTPDPYQQPQQPLPYDFEWSDFYPSKCTYTFTNDVAISSLGSSFWKDNNYSTNELKPGVYCLNSSDKKFDINRQGVKGNVTFVTRGYISGGGSNFNLTAYEQDVLFFTSKSGAGVIDISGSSGMWTGIIFAKNGQIKVQGSDNLSFRGSIIGDRVYLSGSNWSLEALDDGSGEPLVKLVE